VTWATSVPIFVFLGLSVLDLCRCTRQTDRRLTDVRRQTASSLNAPAYGAWHKKRKLIFSFAVNTDTDSEYSVRTGKVLF